MTPELTHAIILHSGETRRADCATAAAYAAVMIPGIRIICFNFSGLQDDLLLEGDAVKFIKCYIRPFHHSMTDIFTEKVSGRHHLAEILSSIITKGNSGWKYWGRSYTLAPNPYSSAALWGNLTGREFEGFVMVSSLGPSRIRKTFRRRSVLPGHFLVNTRIRCVHPASIHDEGLLRRYIREARLGKKSLLKTDSAGAYDFICGCLKDSAKEVQMQKVIGYLSYISMKKFGSMDFMTIGLGNTARIAVIAREKFSLGCEEIGGMMRISKRDAASLLALGYSLKDKAWRSPADKERIFGIDKARLDRGV